jgi:hypothetical protein
MATTITTVFFLALLVLKGGCFLIWIIIFSSLSQHAYKINRNVSYMSAFETFFEACFFYGIRLEFRGAETVCFCFSCTRPWWTAVCVHWNCIHRNHQPNKQQLGFGGERSASVISTEYFFYLSLTLGWNILSRLKEICINSCCRNLRMARSHAQTRIIIVLLFGLKTKSEIKLLLVRVSTTFSSFYSILLGIFYWTTQCKVICCINKKCLSSRRKVI